MEISGLRPECQPAWTLFLHGFKPIMGIILAIGLRMPWSELSLPFLSKNATFRHFGERREEVSADFLLLLGMSDTMSLPMIPSQACTT